VKRGALIAVFGALWLAAHGCQQSLDVLTGAQPGQDAATASDAGQPVCEGCADAGSCAADSCNDRLPGISLASGDQHACAIVDGVLSCWGDNESAQLGTGDTSVHHAPVVVAGNSDWFAVAAGRRHTCGLRAAGMLYCWGDNSQSQLGSGGTRWHKQPFRIGNDADFTELACGGDDCCALRHQGALVCWGSNQDGNVGVSGTGTAAVTSPSAVAAGSTFLQVAVAAAHSCAIRSDGALLCWGSNADGELGTGDSQATQRTPIQVGDGNDWFRIAVGQQHTCGLRGMGTLWCWGSNAEGQIGIGGEGPDGVQQVTNIPTGVLESSGWVDVAVGGYHSCARQHDKPLACWGRGQSGQLGAGVMDIGDTPLSIPQSDGFRNLALGAAFSCAFESDRTLQCWGDNTQGQLGVGDTNERDQPTVVTF
jgi:alpha-tubulin suppressor-like RCC1 family protein